METSTSTSFKHAYSYGRSMYGGWYINYYVIDRETALIISVTGHHTDTLTNLKKWAKENGIDIKKVARRDN